MTKQQILKQLKSNSKRALTGMLGELIVLNALRYSVGIGAKIVRYAGASGDILLNSGVRYEVKTAMQGSRDDFKFCLRKNDKHGFTDYRDSDYIILQCVHSNGLLEVYCIPTDKLDQKHITLGKASKKYKPYRTTYGKLPIV